MSEIFVGASPSGPQHLLLSRANRHGLVAGATGTGKTVTLQILAQAFSDAGVPVFAADVKGDLSGMAVPGDEAAKLHPKLVARAEKIGLDPFTYQAAPCVFWDVFGKLGHPLRTTVTEIGPTLLSRILQLNDTQEGVLNIAFQLADDERLMLLDLKDLRALIAYVAERRQELGHKYGHVAPASIGAIQRRLLVLEREGVRNFFGEPALNLSDMIKVDKEGKGQVNILDATKLIESPKLYSTFLLWLLAELFEELPEVGDPDKPKLVFFFDEAHLLFDGAPRALLDKIEQTVKLIRSKGIGVFFVTQNPRDIPDEVLAQLGNRFQHALRAYTPKEQRAVRAAADAFRPNPDFDTEETITMLGVGEALVSTLDEKGAPLMVQQTLIRPPSSRLGPLKKPERDELLKASPIYGVYDEMVDRESAYEFLEDRAARNKIEQEREEEAQSRRGTRARTAPKRRSSSRRVSSTERLVGGALRQATRTAVREVIRGLLGSLRR